MATDDLEIPEPMAAFFNARSADYDDHMRTVALPGPAFAQFYRAVSAPIERTKAPLHILDLGCGTGLEIEPLLQRVPHARITAVDLAADMLAQLRARYCARLGQIAVVMRSYLTMPVAAQSYDHAISAMSMHHLLHDAKRELYRKIRGALRPGGRYIEGDSVIPMAMEGEFLAEYRQLVAAVSPAGEGAYHIDIPFSIGTQRALLLEAGFTDFELIWQRDASAVWNAAVYAVTA